MAGKSGKIAAAGAAAVAVAGGAAHFSGAFADDAVRSGSRLVDNVPTPRLAPRVTPRPRIDEPAPQPAGQAGATDDLVREGESDVSEQDIICFAYQNFVDGETGEFVAPSEDEFLRAVVEELAPDGSQLDYRFKADNLYEALSDPDADLFTVADELAC